MPLEPVDHLDDLVVTNPTDTDPVSEGDNHMRNIKVALAAGVTGNADETRLLANEVATLLAKIGAVDIIGSALTMFAADLTMLMRMLNNGGSDVGVVITMAAGGFVQIAETDGGGVQGNTWVGLTRSGGVQLSFDGDQKFVTSLAGIQVTGQARVNEVVPLQADDLTRKDYVDTLVAAVQADLDNVKNGFAFTGPISAPTVTEV